MTIKTIALSGLLASSLLLSGCIISVDGEDIERSHSSWQEQEKDNRKAIARLKTGMALETVMEKMGEADFSEAVQRQQGAVQVLYYRTHRQHKDGVTTKEECTPLVFVDGELTGWGEAAYRSTL